MEDRPTVFVLKEQVRRDRDGDPVVYDYSGLAEYGDIEFITTFDPPTTHSVSMNDQWNKEVTAFLYKYNPARDWIVPTGSALAIFKLGHRLGSLNPKLLVWQNRSGKYHQLGVSE